MKRGKLGDAVGYNVTNSNDKDKQGWRVYQPVVSNPQTDAQIDQRVKMQAVNNLYRALKPIVTRGWENHKYGDESRRAFLKKALGASFEGPYIEKGSTLAVPIKNVPIMYGSLSPIVSICDDVDGLLLANVPNEEGNITTIGNLSRLLIAANVAQDGDQITIVIGVYSADSGTVSYQTCSFFVNTLDESPTTNFGFSCGQVLYDTENVVSLKNFRAFMGQVAVTAYCGLVSVSRDGDGQHLRSTAEFDMTTTFRSLFYGNTEQNERAKASYKKTLSTNTNWEQNPDIGPLYGFTAKRGDGTVIVPVAVTVNDNGFTVVEDSQSNILYVKGVGVKALSYNRWLKAKSGVILDDMWGTETPATLENTQWIAFNADPEATANDISFYNFLVASGYDPRGLLGNLPQS